MHAVCDVCCGARRPAARRARRGVFIAKAVHRGASVCELCTSRALHEGWVREGDAGVRRPATRLERRVPPALACSGRLRARRDAPRRAPCQGARHDERRRRASFPLPRQAASSGRSDGRRAMRPAGRLRAGARASRCADPPASPRTWRGPRPASRAAGCASAVDALQLLGALPRTIAGRRPLAQGCHGRASRSAPSAAPQPASVPW